MKVYTKGGDKGRTSLVGGARISKADFRVEAYGTLDELTAFLGLLHDQYLSDTVYAEPLQRTLGVVMDAAAILAGAEGRIPAGAATTLEEQIDHWSETLPALQHFTLPLGYAPTSATHVCRTICRRAERAVVRIDEQSEALGSVQIYLNRLSDWLYVLGRRLMSEGGGEVLWHSNLESSKK